MNRSLFRGLFVSGLGGDGRADSNKYDNYDLRRDNAESFLEVNNCSAYGIYK